MIFFYFVFLVGYILTTDAQGVGIAFSGAGGRIGQHIAIAEALIEGNYAGGVPIRPSYLSGASSGSLSSVLVSAVLQTKETGQLNFTWDYVKQTLFNVTTGDIIDDTYLGILKIQENMLYGYILDNTPMVNFLREKFAEAGYKKFGDLYIPTSVTLVNQSSGYSVRFWSDDPRWKNLDLLELIIASCSLPPIFVPRQIADLGSTIWIDGGTGIDTLPVYSLIQRESVTSIYAVCYNSALTSGGGTEPSWMNDIPLLKNSMAAIDDMRIDLYLGALYMLSTQYLKPAFSFIPNINQTFSTLDFDDEKLEYTLASNWARTNNPQRLNPTPPPPAEGGLPKYQPGNSLLQ